MRSGGSSVVLTHPRWRFVQFAQSFGSRRNKKKKIIIIIQLRFLIPHTLPPHKPAFWDAFSSWSVQREEPCTGSGSGSVLGGVWSRGSAPGSHQAPHPDEGCLPPQRTPHPDWLMLLDVHETLFSSRSTPPRMHAPSSRAAAAPTNFALLSTRELVAVT